MWAFYFIPLPFYLINSKPIVNNCKLVFENIENGIEWKYFNSYTVFTSQNVALYFSRRLPILPNAFLTGGGLKMNLK